LSADSKLGPPARSIATAGFGVEAAGIAVTALTVVIFFSPPSLT
jgi:hypothetical protein